MLPKLQIVEYLFPATNAPRGFKNPRECWALTSFPATMPRDSGVNPGAVLHCPALPLGEDGACSATSLLQCSAGSCRISDAAVQNRRPPSTQKLPTQVSSSPAAAKILISTPQAETYSMSTCTVPNSVTVYITKLNSPSAFMVQPVQPTRPNLKPKLGAGFTKL